MPVRARTEHLSALRAEHDAAGRADRRSRRHPEDVGGPPRLSGAGAAGGRASPLRRPRRRAGARGRPRARGGAVARRRRSIGRRAGDMPAPASIFAGLARRRPDLQPMTLSKPALLALSRAIEDEHLAGARGGVAGRELPDRPVLPAIRAALARARAQRAGRGRAGGLQAAAPACRHGPCRCLSAATIRSPASGRS